MIKKRVLVTGGAKRIGRAICEILSQAGYTIAIHYNQSRLQAEALAKKLPGAFTIQANLANAKDVEGLIKKAEDTLGGHLGALVNNASTYLHDDVLSITLKSQKMNFGVNFFTPLALSLSFFDALPPQSFGAIVNMIDQRVLGSYRDHLSYTLSKQALQKLNVTLAEVLAPRVHVVGIGPGPTLQNIYQSPSDFNAEIASLPLGLSPHPQDIAATVKMALENSALSGQMIAIDGGQHFSARTRRHAR